MCHGEKSGGNRDRGVRGGGPGAEPEWRAEPGSREGSGQKVQGGSQDAGPRREEDGALRGRRTSLTAFWRTDYRVRGWGDRLASLRRGPGERGGLGLAASDGRDGKLLHLS